MREDWLDDISRLLLDPTSTETPDPQAESAVVALAAAAPRHWLRPSLRDELLASARRLDHPPAPETITRAASTLLDLNEEATLAVLSQARLTPPWPMHPAPGVDILPVRPGPARRRALCCLVRLVPGAVFPAHWHQGEETTFVLDGGFRDDDGALYWAGDDVTRTDAGPHQPRAVGVDPCVCLVVARGGVSFTTPDAPL